jgi:hypothetical protein
VKFPIKPDIKSRGEAGCHGLRESVGERVEAGP